MSKRQFKSQASSGRVAGGFGAFSASGFGSTQSSVLSYVQEPPDYSTITDANIVVAFKNLSKKDSTTKAKALEDLQAALINADIEVEDAILDSWVKLFPRLSIDSARRVRQLAFNFNGQLCAKCGKRVAKHLPKIAGPWLAGIFDVDRAAAKAAQDGLAHVFPSSEKVHGLKKTFQEPILEYCQNAVLNETVKTLSDERSVSPDDANATYARVVSTGLAVVANLLEDLSEEETSKQGHIYKAMLSDARLWDFAHFSDPNVRRSTHRLLRICLKQDSHVVADNLGQLSQAYIYKALPSDQMGSSGDFVETLSLLTSKYPYVWTDAYNGKKSALSRLRLCLQHGSHSGSSTYWESMYQVFRNLPAEVLPITYDDAAELLSAMHRGITKKEERFNASAAWYAYFRLVDIVSTRLSSEECENIVEAFAMPPINQYIHPSEESASWAIMGAKPAALLARVAFVKHLPPLLERKWQHLAEKLIELTKMSQPEQSKDYEKSQIHVASVGERWADLQREFYSDTYNLPLSTKAVFARSNTMILEGCISLLKSRNGKPYGAAAVVEEQLRNCGQYLMQDESFASQIKQFITQDLPSLITSPSHRHLALCLYAMKSEPEFANVMTGTLQVILTSEQMDDEKAKSIHALFPRNVPSEAVDVAQNNAQLQQFLATFFSSDSSPQTPSIFSDLLRIGAISKESSDAILSKITESLSLSSPQLETSLLSLEQLTSANPEAIQSFVASGSGQHLLPSVLKLEQSPDQVVAERASKLSTRLTSNMGEAAADAKFSVIRQNLEEASRTSLSINVVTDMAQKLLSDGINSESLDKLLPNQDIWIRSIVAAIKPPKLSLSLLNPFGGAIKFVLPGRLQTDKALPKVQYDSDGLSQALRIAMHVVKLLAHQDVSQQLGGRKGMLITSLIVCSLAAEDNLSILGANHLWHYAENASLETELLDFVTEVNAFLGKYIETLTPASALDEADDTAGHINGFGILQREHVHTALTYYAALGDCKARESIFESHGFTAEITKAAEVRLKQLKSAKEPADLTCCIVGYAQPLQGSQVLIRFCNELVADLTSVDSDTDPHKGFEMLVMLNAILHTQDDIIDTIAKPRLIFMIKHIIPWLASRDVPTKAEVLRSLTMLLPGYQDMYGEHWAQIVTAVVRIWTSAEGTSDGEVISESGIVLLHQSLRLYAALDKVSKSADVNDDLVEMLKENKNQIYDGLTGMLKFADGISDETHQPLMITNELLARQISRLPNRPLPDAEDFFSLLYTPSRAIQGAAFDLLHRHIPAAQEQISLDAALDKKTAQLPDELLSLIIEPPTLDSLADASFERFVPTALQGYLLSWRLIFDHFSGSSYKVKTDYVEQLKEGAYLGGLLDLSFDFLGHSLGRPIDVSKFEIENYTSDAEPTPERDIQSLLTHLYYLALLNLPNLVKSYFLDIRSRQTSLAVESWTAKHISPLIIATSLQAVADWSEKSVKEDPEYENMTVKVGMRSKEINVSYLVDEQAMAIKVVLPDEYPLASADVQSVSRVAVKDEKWQSWLRNCRGVIAFSNGSIIDGLSTWRKNVVGTLKGQTECAICYSIISGDKQLPTKRCPTCKNLFHSSCLYKWFKTSNASTCPLCRNPFNFN